MGIGLGLLAVVAVVGLCLGYWHPSPRVFYAGTVLPTALVSMAIVLILDQTGSLVDQWGGYTEVAVFSVIAYLSLVWGGLLIGNLVRMKRQPQSQAW